MHRPLIIFFGKHKKILVNLAKYGVGLALLVWVVWRNWRPDNSPGLGQIWDEHVIEGRPIPHPEFYLFALLLCLVSTLLTFVRWYVLVRAVGLPFRVSDCLRLGMVGYFFNAFLPGSVGGDFIKAAFLAREHERRTLAVATVVMDRIFALWALVWFVAILGGAFWVDGQLQGDTAHESKAIVSAALGICALSGLTWLALGFLSEDQAEQFAVRLTGLRKIGHSAGEFWRAIWIYRCRQTSVYLSLVMAFIGFFGFVLTFYFAVRTLADPGERIPTLQEHFLVIPIGMVIQAMPGLPGGLGLGEWGFGAMYEKMQCAPSLGVLGSLVQRTITWVLGLIGYLVYLRMRPDSVNFVIRSTPPMTQVDLQTAARRQPFEPFRLVLTTGTTYDIRHPDLIMVGESSAIIGVTDDPAGTAYDRTIKVDLLHVVGIEELPPGPPSANGNEPQINTD